MELFFWAMSVFSPTVRFLEVGCLLRARVLDTCCEVDVLPQVLAIEASKDMVALARLNMERNGYSDKIKVLHNMSNNVTLQDDEKADVIVSETLGALMLGEGMLDYLSDARRRLAKPGAAVIPAGGAQYAMLVMSPSLAMVSSVQPQCNNGFDLSAIGSLQDTGNLFFTKQWGFRLNSLPDLVPMSERLRILEVDYQRTERHHLPQIVTFQVPVKHDGIVHAVVASWEVWSHEHSIATHPEVTKDSVQLGRAVWVEYWLFDCLLECLLLNVNVVLSLSLFLSFSRALVFFSISFFFLTPSPAPSPALCRAHPPLASASASIPPCP